MELRQIEYFCAVGKLNSFTRAAELMHIAQPSITQAIRKLEQELDVQLFDRSKKKAVLTTEGRVFLSRMEKVLEQIYEGTTEIRDLKALRRGTVRVGVPPMIEAYLFPEVFSNFKNDYPGLQLIAFEEASSLDSATKLEREELDLAIIILPEQSDTLNTLVMLQEELVLCVNPQHPLGNHEAVLFEQLKNEKFILLRERSFQHQAVLNRCMKQHFMPDTVFCSNQVKTIINLVANGSGVSLLMKMVAKNTPNLAVVPLDEPIKFNVGLAWKKDKHLSNASKAFIKFIEDRYIQK